MFWHDDCYIDRGMNTEKPNINVNLRRTLLIILGIVVAFLLSFGSRVIALNPQDINVSDRLVTDKGNANEPAISWNLSRKVSDDLTSLFLSKLSQIKK